MKESANRYYIMMFCEDVEKSFLNEEEYKKFLIEYAKNNKNPKNQFVFGNFKIKFSEDKSKVIEYSVYKKITVATNLETIDGIVTSKYENEDDIKSRYYKEVETGKGKLYIGYMYKGQARTLPLFYKKDKIYTDYKELTNLMIAKILEPTFLAKIWTHQKFNTNNYKEKINECLEKIQVAYGKYVMQRTNDTSEIENSIRDFMKAWCTSKGTIDQRSVREVGSIIKNILISLEKAKEEPKEDKKKEAELIGISEKPIKRTRSLTNSEQDITLF